MNKLKVSIMRAFVAAFVLTVPAFAAGPQSFYGVWGTQAQCGRVLITSKGTKRAMPFDIQSDWLGHGDVWCRLHWLAEFTDSDGVFAAARALCGEDAVQAYRIEFTLEENLLTLIWNQQRENGPLMRCLE